MSSYLLGMDIPGGPPTLKKTPQLSSAVAQQKVNKPAKTYIFELELGESNDHTYPEFSWADLVKDAKNEELEEKRKQQGGTLLDPYASDDEEHLKDLAARLEEKYGGQSSTKPSRKKKQKLDDLDRAAGYDESDSFIDNTDAYDEKIPKELQPACGGFYINSGQLDFKEVQVSEDDDDDSYDDSVKAIAKPKPLKSVNPTQKDKLKVLKSSSPPPKLLRDGIIKKRKISQDKDTPVSRPKHVGNPQKPRTNNVTNSNTLPVVNNNETSNKKRPRQISSSSSSSSESSSSTSSDDSSTSSESNAEEPKTKAKGRIGGSNPEIMVLNSKETLPLPQQKQKKKPTGSLPRPSNTNMPIKPTTLTPRKPRVKNVPLNPNLKRTDVPGAIPINNNNTPSLPPATITRKIINPKDFVKSKTDFQGPKLNRNSAPLNKPLLLTPPQNSPMSSPSLPVGNTGNKTSTPTSVIKVPTPKSSAFNSTSTSQTNGMVTTTPTSQMLPKSTSSQLSLSSELAQIFSETAIRQSITTNFNSAGNSSANVTYNKTSQPTQQKTKSIPVSSTSVEAMANDTLRTIANTSSVGSHLNSDKRFPDMKKPLPKLKHKSGFTVEQQRKQSAISPPSSFNAKPKKVDPKTIIFKPLSCLPGSSSQRVSSPQNATITATSEPLSSAFQTSSAPYNPGTIEITKIKKKTAPLPALGSGITVTEVRDKSAMTNAGNSMFGAKGPSLNQRSPVSATNHQSSNFTPVISSSTSSLSTSNQKISHSVTISPSPLQNLTSDLSDRFNIGNFLVNKQSHSLPGFITSYDVNALLSGSNPLPDIPSSKRSSESSSSSTNPNLNRN